MPGITTNINSYNKNKFQLRFSDFPNMTGDVIDIHVLNNYVKGFNVPDISIPMLTSVFGHERQLHPNTIGHRDLQTINIEFQVDEEMKNWYIMYCWLYNTRKGLTSGKTDLKGDELVRLNCIDTIELASLNNNNEVCSKMKFNHCILNNIGSLSLEFGSSEIASFVCTFEYESINLELPNFEE